MKGATPDDVTRIFMSVSICARRAAKWIATLALVTLTQAPIAVAQESAGPVVNVTGGQVQGKFLPSPGGAVFKGIPYAAPPVGDLRWRETKPVGSWSGVLPAGEFRAGCGQSVAGDAAKTEDCLYLNVWSPRWPARERLPVILWINGGELAGGSGALKPGAESLARRGVILVSANYRGTLLGMMGHPELTAESPHHGSANYGLFDEVAVLNWIRDNIARFGGDPRNVTVLGQSGGGHVISMLLASPLTKGLIHRAIIHSGAPMQTVRPYLSLNELEKIGVVAAAHLKAPATDTLAFLRQLPAADLVAAMPAVRTALLEMDGQAYDEGVDGHVITEYPNEVWGQHRELPVPLIIGSTSQDTAAAIAGEAPLDPKASPEEVQIWQRRILEILYRDAPDLLERALRNYGLRGAPNEVSTYPPYGSPALQLGVDLNHRCSTGLSAALHSAIAPTWQFEFTRSTPGHPPTHSSDLRYVFGLDELEDAAARQQSNLMQQYWTNFARTGDPNGPGLPSWPKYEPATKLSLEFSNEGPVQRRGSRAGACGPYNELYSRDPKRLSGGDDLRIRGTGGAR